MENNNELTSSQTAPAERAGKPQSTTRNIIIHRQASEIKMKEINWLWPNRIARGKITMISGNPGLGKSQIIAYMTSIVTTKGQFVDGTECNGGKVFILSAEDDAADTIVPRLKAAGADLTHTSIIDSVMKNGQIDTEPSLLFNLLTDIGALENLIITLGDVAAIFIDPITAYLGSIDDHKNSQVRSVLGPLAKLAEKHNIAIICISHHNKSGSPEALLRVIGSIGFVAAARAAYAVIKDPSDESKRFFLPLKNNIGNDKTGLKFSIESHPLDNNINTSRIVWSDEVINTTADEILQLQNNPVRKTARNDAKKFLSELLTKGPVKASDIIKAAENRGYSIRTIERAKEELDIISKKDGTNGEWSWHMPVSAVN
jgi:hypothetical protein